MLRNNTNSHMMLQAANQLELSPYLGAVIHTAIAHTILGPLYIAIVIFTTLYGVSTVQAVIYYQKGHKDSLLLRLTVLALWLSDTGLLGVVIYCGCRRQYDVLGTTTEQLDPYRILGLWYTVAGLSDVMTCCIMIWMAWRLADKNMWLLSIMVVPTVAAFGPPSGFFAYSFLCFRKPLTLANKSNATCQVTHWTSNLRFVIRLLVIWFVNAGSLQALKHISSISQYTLCCFHRSIAFNSLLGLLNTREYRQEILCAPDHGEEPAMSRARMSTSIHFATMPHSSASDSMISSIRSQGDTILVFTQPKYTQSIAQKQPGLEIEYYWYQEKQQSLSTCFTPCSIRCDVRWKSVTGRLILEISGVCPVRITSD
ncbi:hypothetical protein BC629DRAFT_1725292, partial [Irpex lacteus]